MLDLSSDLNSCRRLAVMGGTFDPIHYGHLTAAYAVRHAYQVERVLFLPLGKPPHKEGASVTVSAHRLEMTRLAIQGNPYFDLSRMETDRDGYTYTIDTVKELRGICPHNAEIYFITGADEARQLHAWKHANELLRLCRIIAVTRPGFDGKGSPGPFIAAKPSDRIEFLEIPALSISGTDIRRRVAKGQPIKYLLPPEVESYICNNRLYLNDGLPSDDRLESIKRLLSLRLSGERYAHTVGVAEEAVRLANLYGADPKKSYLAGLLHDCAKEFGPKKKRELCGHFGIPLDPILEEQIDLTHSLLGAEMARDDFGVFDPEILQAIRYHTTGRGAMSLLDKVIMLADYTETTRDLDPYPGLCVMRALADVDINEALIYGLEMTMRDNGKKGRRIHPWSTQTVGALKNE